MVSVLFVLFVGAVVELVVFEVGLDSVVLAGDESVLDGVAFDAGRRRSGRESGRGPGRGSGSHRNRCSPAWSWSCWIRRRWWRCWYWKHPWGQPGVRPACPAMAVSRSSWSRQSRSCWSCWLKSWCRCASWWQFPGSSCRRSSPSSRRGSCCSSCSHPGRLCRSPASREWSGWSCRSGSLIRGGRHELVARGRRLGRWLSLGIGLGLRRVIEVRIGRRRLDLAAGVGLDARIRRRKAVRVRVSAIRGGEHSRPRVRSSAGSTGRGPREGHAGLSSVALV